jgi:4-diphosphocytidyl-2-C-methyl-D-erythritol kinase
MMGHRKAFAKINLDLRIVSTLADGYHALDTVFQTITLHDTIVLERVGGDIPFTCVCDAPDVPSGAQNLVWRAAHLLWRALGRQDEPTGLRVNVRKGIPARAGLGGGSADAAVALALLAHEWHVPLDDPRCRDVGRRLGADVSFFFVGGTARGTGRGDRIAPCPDLPPLEVVLAMPPFGVSTVEAYRWYDASGAAPSAGAAGARAWPAWLAACRNDLEPPVAARHPVIRTLTERLRAAGALHALMSGSGSAVFGLFETPEGAAAGLAAVGALGVPAHQARLLGRDAYMRDALGTTVVPRLPPD